MGIGHEFFEAMINKPPFTAPKKQEHIKTISPIKSVLSDEVIRRGYFYSKMTFNKDDPKAHPLWFEKFRQIGLNL
jgi:hypothetical protein